MLSVVPLNERLRPDRHPLGRFTGKPHFQKMPRVLQPRRLDPFGHKRNLLVHARVALRTIDGGGHNRNPELSQQLRELGVWELVSGVNTQNAQSIVGRRQMLDTVVPRVNVVGQRCHVPAGPK